MNRKEIEKILKRHFELKEKEYTEKGKGNNHKESLYCLSSEEILEDLQTKESLKKNIEILLKEELISLCEDVDLKKEASTELRRRSLLF